MSRDLVIIRYPRYSSAVFGRKGPRAWEILHACAHQCTQVLSFKLRASFDTVKESLARSLQQTMLVFLLRSVLRLGVSQQVFRRW